MFKKFSERKPRYLCSTMMTADGDDGIEVGGGFEVAAESMSGDDNRPKPKPAARRNKPAPTPTPAPAASADDDQGDDDGDDQGDDDDQRGQDQGDDGEDDDGQGDDDGDDQGDDDDGKPAKGTAKYIRELRRDRREDRRRIADLEARLVGGNNQGLPAAAAPVTIEPTRPAPDPTDTAKYPLGVLDDRYIEEKIDWVAEQKTAAAIAGQRQTDTAQAAQVAETARLSELRNKVEDLTDVGAELFPDFEEQVLETGLAGKWKLTETTFTAAAESKHGAEILYNLSKDKKEAARVAALSVRGQVLYIEQQNSEIAEKRKARRKPQAGNPPSNAPRGRNANNPIRPDTDNLKDFKKLYYSGKD